MDRIISSIDDILPTPVWSLAAVDAAALPAQAFTLTRNNNCMSSMTIFNNGQEYVSINLATGKLTYGGGYEADKAAQLFWEAIGSLTPIQTNDAELESMLEDAVDDRDDLISVLNQVRKIVGAAPGEDVRTAALRLRPATQELKSDDTDYDHAMKFVK